MGQIASWWLANETYSRDCDRNPGQMARTASLVGNGDPGTLRTERPQRARVRFGCSGRGASRKQKIVLQHKDVRRDLSSELRDIILKADGALAGAELRPPIERSLRRALHNLVRDPVRCNTT